MKTHFCFFSIFILSFFCLSVNATIPQAAMNDYRFSLGYLVVTHYPGVDSTGMSDSKVGLQQAIDDAFDNGLVVLFPSGTYLVSDVLKCYSWQLWNVNKNQPINPAHYHHVLVGSFIGSRPIIKLQQNASGFGNSNNPRPVLVFRNFTAENLYATSKAEPSNPLTGEPANFRDGTPNLFEAELRNIDFDLNNNAGAIGVSFAAAQGSSISNVKIDATNAYAGFYGIPGRNGCTANIEVQGGKYGISTKDMNDAGNMIVGAKLFNQTERALIVDDFSVLSMVGFYIKSNSDTAIQQLRNSYTSAGGSMTLVDGKIEMLNSGLAIDNGTGRNLYIENVYVENANYIIKCGSEDPITGSQAWKRIIQYCYTNQDQPDSGDPPYETGDGNFKSWSLINGALSNDPEPITNFETAQPMINFIDRHLWQVFPSWEGELNGSVNILNFGATANDTTDDYSAIQTAINFAAESGNGIVFIPKGEFIVRSPLELKSNTCLFGASQKTARISTDEGWNGSPNDFTIRTVDDADATSFLGLITVYESNEAVNKGSVLWRAGKNSMIKSVTDRKPWKSYIDNQVRYKFCFSGNGGGKHYICPFNDMTSYESDSRLIFIYGTSQPLSFYGCNVEASKVPPDSEPGIDVNIEINNSENVRIHNIKREGSGATVRIIDSENIGVYGLGRQKIILVPGQRAGGYVQIYGSSNNILVGIVETDNFNDASQKMLLEDIDSTSAVGVDWPESVSVYKRGELSDMYFDDEHVLTLQSSTGGTTIPSQGNYIYFEDTIITVIANPDEGYHFDYWSGGVLDSTSDTSSILVDQDLTITAHFERNPTDTSSVHRTYNKPEIDGEIDNCYNLSEMQKIQNVTVGFTTDSIDLGANFLTLWDSLNLYIYVKVCDDTIFNDSGFAGYHDDGVEIYIDAYNNKDTIYSSDDFMFRFDWDGDSITIIETKHGSIEGIMASRSVSENGYNIEVSIPWLLILQDSIAAGQLLGFEVAVNDDDDGDTRESKITWYGLDDNAFRYPSSFGTVQLVDNTRILTILADSGGTVIPAPGEYYFTKDTLITITAIQDSNFIFSGWSGNVADSTSSVTTVNVNKNTLLTAHFNSIKDTVFYARRTYLQPLIDGQKENVWEASYSDNANHVTVGYVSDSQDLSCRFYSLWDTDKLYFFVDVTDDSIINDSGSQGYHDDGVEIFIDANYDKDSIYGNDDFMFRFDWDGTALIVIETKNGIINGVEAAREATSDGYHIEVAIPWILLQQDTVGIGKYLGFEIGVNDDDDGGIRESKIAWFGTTDIAWQNPSAFGNMILAKTSQAHEPVPIMEGENVTLIPVLSWVSGDGASSHNIYFGTNNPPVYIGNQTDTSFTPVDTLNYLTTYYWKVDELSNGGIIPGNLWSFTTVIEKPLQASNPTPGNNTNGISILPELSFTPGERSSNHNIYFGTSTPLPLVSTQTDTVYLPDSLDYNTTYYWYVDEENEGGTNSGSLWSFTTEEYIPSNLIVNPGFELDDIVWVGNATSSRVSEIGNALSGNWSWKIANTTADWKYGKQNIDSIKPNTPYKLEGYIKTSDVYGGGNARIEMRFYNGLDLVGNYSSSSVSGTNDFTYRSVTATTPQEVTSALIRLAMANCSGTAWFDDLSLTEDRLKSAEILRLYNEESEISGYFLVYPNPGSGTINLEIRLEESANAEVAVYSASGVKIQTLLNKKLKSGIHTESCNISELSAGFYFLRLNTGLQSEIKPYIIIK